MRPSSALILAPFAVLLAVAQAAPAQSASSGCSTSSVGCEQAIGVDNAPVVPPSVDAVPSSPLDPPSSQLPLAAPAAPHRPSKSKRSPSKKKRSEPARLPHAKRGLLWHHSHITTEMQGRMMPLLIQRKAVVHVPREEDDHLFMNLPEPEPEPEDEEEDTVAFDENDEGGDDEAYNYFLQHQRDMAPKEDESYRHWVDKKLKKRTVGQKGERRR